MGLFLFWLIVYIIYTVIEEFQEDSRYREECYRTKELSELKKRESQLIIRRRTIENNLVTCKEEYFEKTETYKR